MKQIFGWMLAAFVGMNLILLTLFVWIAIVPAVVQGTMPLWVPKVVEALK